jgi:ribosomal protein S18 acetylase RimI-like enzyme
MSIAPARADELDAVVVLIAAQQQRPERNIVYLGEEVGGIRAELAELQPDWETTVRVAHDAAGDLAGVALAEWSDERAWVLGPWVAGDDTAWARWARPLLDAVAAQVPEEILDREMAGSLANERLAELAGDLGWPPSETNYAYTLDADVAAAFPSDGDDGMRLATGDDLAAITALHDTEFPASYFSAAQLLERASTGEQLVLVADVGGSVTGYAAGRVQPDGEGYIDFVAVDPAARGGGIGRRLVVDLSRRLLRMSTTGRVSLTVQGGRAPARALYTALGFRVDAAFRGYRSLPIGRQT